MKLLREMGKTQPDGRTVVGGVFRFYETHGLTLDAILVALDARGCVVDWLDFWDAARAARVKPARLLAMIETAVADALSSSDAAAVMRRLRLARPEAS